MKDKLYLDCSDWCSVMKVEPEDDDGIFISFFTQIRSKGIRYKMRQIWKIIRTGEPYEDMFVLSVEDAKRLVDFLKKR